MKGLTTEAVLVCIVSGAICAEVDAAFGFGAAMTVCLAVAVAFLLYREWKDR